LSRTRERRGGKKLPANDGSDLEKLVEAIERQLAPEGFSVVRGERVFDEEGNPVAEFDIRIAGPVGSSEVNWLIECRDRPSDGPAPAQWIEGLVGRRERFGFDKVFAVSTSGFAQGARHYARAKGIVLRTVDRPGELVGDFHVEEVKLALRSVEFTKVMPLLLTSTGKSLLPERALFMPGGGFDTVSLENLILLQLRQTEEGAGWNTEDGAVRPLMFVLASPVEAIVDGVRVWIEHLSVPILLRTRVLTSRALAVRIYAEDGRLLGTEATFEFPSLGPDARFSSLIVRRADGSGRLTMDYPERLPGVVLQTVTVYDVG
jgi:hypothetical protein